MLRGVAKFKGDTLFDVSHSVEQGTKPSEAVTAMKGKVMAGMNAYIAAHNLRSDEADLLEDAGGGEAEDGKPAAGARKPGGGGGKKRKGRA